MTKTFSLSTRTLVPALFLLTSISGCGPSRPVTGAPIRVEVDKVNAGSLDVRVYNFADRFLVDLDVTHVCASDTPVVIEKIESYGMAVGAEVFDTVFWAGWFAEAVHRVPVVLLPRRAVKLALCGDSRAKDANIRQALLDRFGGSAAVGRKASPGPLYGISRDVWSALAIAVTYSIANGSNGAA